MSETVLVTYTDKSGRKRVTAIYLSELNKFIRVYPDAKPKQ